MYVIFIFVSYILNITSKITYIMESKVYPKEREIITTTVGILMMISLYAIYVYNKYVVPDPEIINNSQFWGKAFIFMIPVVIVSMIIFMIFYAILKKIITKEDIDTLSDERDKLIDLKAMRISQLVNTVFMILAMGSQALGMELWVLFVILTASCFLGAFAEGMAKIFFYRRGV